MTVLEIAARFLCVYCGEAPDSAWRPANAQGETRKRWQAHLQQAQLLIDEIAKATIR